jgi:hypothetical protein
MKVPETFSISFFASTEKKGLEILEDSKSFDPGYILQLWEAEPNKYGNAFVGIYFEEHGIPTPDSLGLHKGIVFKRFIKAIRTASFENHKMQNSQLQPKGSNLSSSELDNKEE